MKILIINTVLTGKNGITNVIFNYLNSIDRERVTFDYLAINTPDVMYRNMIEAYGGKLFVLSRLSTNMFIYWSRIRKLIKNGYDAVHIHGNSHTVVLELSAAYSAGCHIRLVHAHNTACKYVVVHKLLTPLFNFFYTHGLACGADAGRFMFGSRPYMVINNGVDVERFGFDAKSREKIRRQLNLDDNDRLLGHVGYFKEVKNQKFIVEILKHLEERYKLILIGDGPLREDTENLVKCYGLESRVIFTGNINNVDEYLNAIDFVVMPSLFEGLPLALIEQQANGLKCVVADTITREVDKTDNLLFLPLSLSAKEWANKIVAFHDNQSRDKQSRRAIECICKSGYSIQEEANKLANYYNEIIK